MSPQKDTKVQLASLINNVEYHNDALTELKELIRKFDDRMDYLGGMALIVATEGGLIIVGMVGVTIIYLL